MRLLIVLLSVLGVSSSATLRDTQVDESKEPPLRLTLLVNGKSQPLEFNKELKLSGTFKDPTIVVRAASTRRFRYGGVSFEYPANFTWEAELQSKAYRNWTLSGNDSKIMVFAVGNRFTPELYSAGVSRAFGLENAKVSDITRTFGKRKLAGKRVTADIAGSTITQDAFALPAPAGQWRLIVLQDVAPELTPKLKEPKQVLDLLTRTLDVKR